MQKQEKLTWKQWTFMVVTIGILVWVCVSSNRRANTHPIMPTDTLEAVPAPLVTNE